MFDHMVLEPEAKELLATLVEATRNVPRDQRARFLAFSHFSATGQRRATIQHAQLQDGAVEVYRGDLDSLSEQGLIRPSFGRGPGFSFDVSAQGFQYYEYMKQEQGQPVERVETSVRAYLDADGFRKKYPMAYDKWSVAEGLLWSSDSDEQSTMIGHLCREAIQGFATALVDQFQPPSVTQDKTKDVNRIRAVLDQRSAALGSAEKDHLEALVEYWRKVSALVQRQEHGAAKEGEALIWEDARRVVFQTMLVMFEVDRSLSRGGG